MTHTPTATNNLLICPACSYRAVLTTQGLIVTDKGDDTIDHLAVAEAAAQLSHDTAERLMTRLREQYASGAAFDGKALTLRQLQRLYRAVAGEFIR